MTIQEQLTKLQEGSPHRRFAILTRGERQDVVEIRKCEKCESDWQTFHLCEDRGPVDHFCPMCLPVVLAEIEAKGKARQVREVKKTAAWAAWDRSEEK